ncbi:MAG: PEP-CTERM sorting domain-containing protein [Phycisphaerales bacterium]|nr:PEP-CTERM sorting domain-containing protein [Phycisphaerales bacterium]
MKIALVTMAALSGIATASVYVESDNAESLNINQATAGAPAAVATITLDLSGINTWDLFGDPDNLVMILDGGPFANELSRVIGVGWDVTIETFDGSWLSEATIAIENSDQSGSFFVGPGSGIDTSGIQSFSSGGLVDLVNEGLDFTLNEDGDFRIEFYETFDDNPDLVDAEFLAGSTLRIQYTIIPAPGSIALLGLGGLMSVRRRR